MNQRMDGPSMLALVGDMTGPTYWRVLAPFTALEKAGYPCGWDRTQNALIGAIAPAFDGYLLPRMSWPPEQRRMAEAWFASLRKSGKIAIYDADDDVFTSAETHRRIELNWTEGKSFERLEAERLERIWTMQQCDGVTVSTQRLATVVRSYTNRPVHVVGNAIDLFWFQKIVRATKRQLPGLTIGWTGGRRHNRATEVMAQAWGRIAQRYPTVRFVVQGWCPAVIREQVPDDRVSHLAWLPLEQYPAGLAQIDIGCCAVADTQFNRAKCVAGDTLVYTEEGLRAISDLVQSRILGMEMPLNMRVWTTGGWAMATGVIYQGDQERVRITTEAGFQIEGTLTHPIRREDDSWALLGDLAIGERVKIARTVFSKHPVRVAFNPWAIRQRRDADLTAPSLPTVVIDENWGRMLGYLVGDGTIAQNHVGITCDAQDQDVIEDVVATFTAIGVDAPRVRASGGRKCENVNVSSARLNDFLWLLGANQGARKALAVPEVILRSPMPVVREFLRGLFESDGTASKSNPTVSFTSKSLTLARQVQLLLTGFGIFSHLSAAFNKVYQQTYYKVGLRRAAVDVFAQEINFVGARKRTTVAATVARPHSNAFRPQVWSDAVATIERTGPGGVFDLVVPGPAEFGAGGFMAHNSPIKAMEYAAAGAGVVASPTLYSSIITDSESGFIAETADEWEDALSVLIDRPSLRSLMQGRLLKTVERRHSLARNLHRWPQAWAEIAESARGRILKLA